MYKLIAIDLDGTLLNSYGEITQINKDAIKTAKDKGIEVVLASGRDPRTMEVMSLELGIDNYLISGNGSTVYDIKEQRYIYKNFIDIQKALKIIEICKENSIFFSIYTTKCIITEGIKYNIKVFNNENNYKPESKRTNINIVGNIYDYIKKQKPNILKIIICDENKVIFNNIIGKIRDVEDVEILEVEHMSKKIIRIDEEKYPIEYFYTEVTNKGSNKWSAIKFLIEKLAIKEEEVMCIGDNINDYEMVKNAGLGVAMRDSALEKLNIADYIADDNNSDGVGKAIYKYIN